MQPGPEYPPVDFPTLGFLVADWGERHCVIPDGFSAGHPFILSNWQLYDVVCHYRVKPTATVGQLAPAFHYRRSQIVRPQKTGKGPFIAFVVCAEAVGPVLFDGWARGGERYRCADHGCECGWVYEYAAGESMGTPWPTPLIQITATSEEQTDNIYGALRPMIQNGRLSDLIPKTGEEFIRLPRGGRIDTVTSSAKSRLGQRVTFVPQDETGIWTPSTGMVKVADVQRRGLAGMGGRSMETTNGWDPAEDSVAQRTADSRRPDIFRDHPLAPHGLRYVIKEDRRKIHRFVYAGSPWVDLDAIEAEAAELLERDPHQAERFFGNRIVQGLGTWLVDGLWDSRKVKDPYVPPDGTPVCAGFDGSDSDDWTAIRLETIDGYRFTPTYGPDSRPTIWNPVDSGGSIPRGEVHAAWDELAARYRIKRAYCDPKDWQSEIGDWSLRWGDDVFLEWATNRPRQMHDALTRTVTDLTTGRTTHDACPITASHVANARKVAYPAQRYMLAKPAGAYHQKIDAAMADVLAHEAASDARASGWELPKSSRMTVMR